MSAPYSYPISERDAAEAEHAYLNWHKLPEAADDLADKSWNVAVNGEMVLSGEASRRIASGDRVALVPIIAGG